LAALRAGNSASLTVVPKVGNLVVQLADPKAA
jgi:hypothetical protein